MTTATPNPRFTLTLQAEPDASDPSGHRRLRMAVKRLGRGYGLRCIALAPVVYEGPNVWEQHQADMAARKAAREARREEMLACCDPAVAARYI